MLHYVNCPTFLEFRVVDRFLAEHFVGFVAYTVGVTLPGSRLEDPGK